jgi:hypothetical protein
MATRKAKASAMAGGEALIASSSIPSGAKAPLLFGVYGGTEVPPLQGNGNGNGKKQRQECKQIPCGNDRKKSKCKCKCNSNDRSRFLRFAAE